MRMKTDRRSGGAPKPHTVGSVLVIAAGALMSLPSVGAAGVLFDDQFSGTGLDASKWSLLNGSVVVDGGWLRIQANGHDRIDSIADFGVGVTATARVSISGNYEKFGLNVNPDEPGRGGTGYYFDSYEDGSGHVRLLAFASSTTLLNQTVSVTWGEAHDFSIERTASKVTFLIDGNPVGDVAAGFTDGLPVGIWNDRSSLMQTDWVQVSAIPEVGTVLLFASPFVVLAERLRRRAVG